ncbi:response regulator [Brumimicrobium aurantiacum]|nr:response regulator [Brumimicrobium aurantiacum]
MIDSKTCVLIDDDKDDQLIFKTVLKQHFPQYSLQTYSSFEQAKPNILAQEAAIDTLFIDLNMPKYNGIDCLNYLRNQEQYKDTPIIIYTTSNNPDDKKRSLQNGATSFLTKPSRIHSLVEELGKYLSE